jgi:dienelactone hydrolase
MFNKFLLSFFLLIYFLIPSSLFSQAEYRSFNWNGDITLLNWLNRQVYYQYRERQKNLSEALNSKEKLNIYKKTLRTKYLKLLGDMPEKTALNPIVTGIIKQNGYRIEKVIYQSFKNHHITANLYIPETKGKHPGVLLFCGHEPTSKSTESYQKTAMLFALNGFVVLVIDPISQSERFQLIDVNGKPLTRGGTTEHSLLNFGSNLLGTSIVSYELFDNLCSLDYLISRPEVDIDLIGCLGNSGGGTQTTYFAAFEDRIKVAAPCSYVSTKARSIELGGMPDGCATLLSEGKEQIEIADYLILFAPKPLLILAGYNDFVDYPGTEEAAQELEKIYNLYGASDKFKLFTADDGHGISLPKREAAVAWFKKWLMGKEEKIIEGDLRILADTSLTCTKTGQVGSSFPEEVNVQNMNLKLFEKFKAQREDFIRNTSSDEQKQKIKEILSINNISDKVESEKIGAFQSDFYQVHKYIVRRLSEPPLPCIILTPQNEKIDSVIIIVDEVGKVESVKNSEYIDNIRRANVLVIPDIRGFGETLPKPDPNEKKFFNKEYRLALTSLHIGKPLLGQRVTDIITIMDFINSLPLLKGKPISLISKGMIIPASIHAAVLDERISRLIILDKIFTWKYYLNNLLEKDVYSNVAPGALRYYDLDDLMELLRVRKNSKK